MVMRILESRKMGVCLYFVYNIYILISILYIYICIYIYIYVYVLITYIIIYLYIYTQAVVVGSSMKKHAGLLQSQQ